MALGDYFKGPEYKAVAARLEVELEAQRQQGHAELNALKAKFDDLETKAREIGILDLLAVKKQIQAEETQLANIKAQVASAHTDLDAVRAQLRVVQQQILGAEDTVLLESFGLYTPKYQFTHSIDYKKRLDEIREDQKQTARGLTGR